MVYLVRHAYAAHADPQQWPDDAARPLTPDGIRKFRAAARGLRRLVPDVDLVLSSGYARAWGTAELLAEESGWPAPQPCAALEAERPAAAAIDVLREHDAGSVALVGHEPYLSRLASILCGGDETALRLRLKKGGVVACDLDRSPAPGAGRLTWTVTPKILRSLDGGG